MSLAESVVDIVTDAANREGAQCVKSVLLEIGDLSCVAPDALNFCFEAVARGTPAEGARLDISRIAGTGLCPSCGQTAALGSLHELCAHCGAAGMQVQRGTEMRVVQIEVA